jgi:hypothetical protein
MLTIIKASGFVLGVVAMVTLTAMRTIGRSRFAWFVIGIGLTLIALSSW